VAIDSSGRLAGLETHQVIWNLMILGFLVVPLTTDIALLKHRLYDIDRIINRTLVYVALTAIWRASTLRAWRQVKDSSAPSQCRSSPNSR
jgi:hypothetical protein